jgi:hypothetical protein
VVGPDGNVYAAGYSEGIGTLADFTVISLYPSGAERWVYRHNGPGDSTDAARSIAVDEIGNLYAAGYSVGSGTHMDFTVISLDTSGTERWVYRYDGPGSAMDEAYSVTAGLDGNIYAAGWSYDTLTKLDMTVISLNTSGTERWVYRYDGPYSGTDGARCVAMGPDTNLYIAGCRETSWEAIDFAVFSVTPSGSERWVWSDDKIPLGYNQAYSVAVGLDCNVYAAGNKWLPSMGDHLVGKLNCLDSSGVYRWMTSWGGEDGGAEAYAIAVGTDGNVYSAGFNVPPYTDDDYFRVRSNTPSGEYRWTYDYLPGVARSIVMGADGNLYAGGEGLDHRFAVISVDTSGVERWVYENAEGGRANSIVTASDSTLNAAGYTGNQFTVVGLGPDVGVQEEVGNRRTTPHNVRLFQNRPNPFKSSTAIRFELAEPAHVGLSIYDITGRLVETLANETQEPGVHRVRWNRKSNPSGVYFFTLKAGEFVQTRKMVVID